MEKQKKAGRTRFDYIIISVVCIISLSFLVLIVSGSSVTIVFNSVIMDDKQIEDEITQLYKTHLNREPDSAGMDLYKYAILDGKSYQWVEETIKNSEEGKAFDMQSKISTYQKFITNTYQKYLDKDPNEINLDYYTTKMLEGDSYLLIESEIKNSEEGE